uniref:Queuosine 5'-phosphate N-glycosylase/hydrolase n=2 Tax=Spongospora subterranea TaxID=70186 RepID=A0A0H5QQF9_9EUKA|eukprot:CRZ03837.1 hypothetical protein [Spongospora subterranea]
MSRLVIPTLEPIEFKLVQIHDEGIDRFAQILAQQSPKVAMYTDYQLHPKPTDPRCPNWIFLIDSLNFSFWNEDPSRVFSVSLGDGGPPSTGYASICAIIWRALDEGYPMTDAAFWRDLDEPTWRHVARGDCCEIPLILKRLEIINATGATLCSEFGGDFANLISKADRDVYRVLELVLDYFPPFRDQTPDGQYKFLKRAQILIADLWSCFDGKGIGKFDNINEVTMFADYRVPQSLLNLGIISYSEKLLSTLADGQKLNELNENVVLFGREEIEIRASSILAVDRVQKRLGPSSPWNSILIDFYLWNYSKTIDRKSYPFHRVRSIYY